MYVHVYISRHVTMVVLVLIYVLRCAIFLDRGEYHTCTCLVYHHRKSTLWWETFFLTGTVHVSTCTCTYIVYLLMFIHMYMCMNICTLCTCAVYMCAVCDRNVCIYMYVYLICIVQYIDVNVLVHLYVHYKYEY